ncbi:MAG: hypothetical protein PHV90_03075 [Smithella sp.]|jgi:hypothetical protein|nr:hypothetical protein KD27_05080 [Smithella sp. D17]MDD5524200.1 hypothetical protein [Smithella sp.]
MKSTNRKTGGIFLQQNSRLSHVQMVWCIVNPLALVQREIPQNKGLQPLVLRGFTVIMIIQNKHYM